MNDLELLRALRGLDAGRDPQRDLWPGIAAAIAATPRPAAGRDALRRWTPWALAASALLASVLMWPQRLTEPAAPPAPEWASATPLLREADALSLEYRVALAQLAEAPLPPALRPALRELKDSEQSLRAALREQPESVYLLEQLRRTYEQQLRLSQLVALG